MLRAVNELVGTTIGGKYRLDRQLGAGGMGMVFAATQVGLNRKCAVKLLHESLSQDGQLVARFKREAEVAASMGHPNIVQVTDFGFEDGKVFLVMDLLQGLPLADAIEQGAPLQAERVRFIAAQVLSALDAAHKRDIVHRDLKPDNIFLTSLSGVADVVKLLDFGIARITGEKSQKMTTTGQVLGTPAYMSPEQARGKKVDHRTDLYSLGVVMYEALSGRMPVEGSNYHELMFNIVGEDPLPLQEYRPDLPKALLDIVAKSMAKKVEERYQSAVEMRRELEALGPIEASSPPAVMIPSTRPGGATTDADAFAKTVTPEHVLPVDTQRPGTTKDTADAVAPVDTQRGVDGVRERSPLPMIIGAVGAVLVAVVIGVVMFTQPDDEVVAVNAPPTQTPAEQDEEQDTVRELAKVVEQLQENQRRLDEERAQMGENAMEEAPAPDMASEPTEVSMSSMSEMSSMSAMSSMSSMRGGGRPSHARFTLIDAPPEGDWRRRQCCPDAWHDGYNNPIVWATCGGNAHEVYPVLPNTRISVSSWNSGRVVAMDQFRPWTLSHADAITSCYRGKVVANGQNIRLDIDADGKVTGVRFHQYCPVPSSVRSCVSNLLMGAQLPPDERAPGEASFSLHVDGS